MRNWFLFLFSVFALFAEIPLFAQGSAPPFEEQYPFAKSTSKEMYRFDVARPVKHFDALPDGSDWFAVDEFALLQTMIIRGERFEKRFNEIPKQTARFSPAGDYLIWMGLERSFDQKGFNTTTTSVYRTSLKSTTPDSVGKYTSDYNLLFFSPSGKHWAATLPAASVYQSGLRDVVLFDGLIVAKGNPLPSAFSFDATETGWAYRSTDDRDENLVTQFAIQKMYTRAKKNQYVASFDPIVYNFSPDLKLSQNLLDSRDYEFGFRHQAQLFKTTYLPGRLDTSHVYIIFNNKRQQNFNWITNIQIDTAGAHIAYIAGDTSKAATNTQQSEKSAVIVKDEKIIAGPYDEIGRLFMSPS
ncbi:MAG: hypothetical protein ABI778_05270, partial [Ignavibacteriota bacterium]